MTPFHEPGDERRSVVIVPLDACEDWLGGRNKDKARSFLTSLPADEMAAEIYLQPP
ncbi:hypothetical protein R69608_07636 [Paraburkholderia nemoris]|uniref:hypothetical protein n=1 Tax=Paraburkholderia nemoris TaxID=2793076 RepID=UPI001912076D|nr:hypothetical protein [Paraburkholderia nemoris]MBK5153160.1 hypothetical protein [Burkholderia sp. R-69608]CAE6971617.1 hypothetical protein R69608_07636 [Paraburkholderia nemoris]